MSADNDTGGKQSWKQVEDEPLESTLMALTTVSLLELRLARLEHAITGSSDPASLEIPRRETTTVNVATRLAALEQRLADLKRLDGLSGSLVRMVDTLHKEYPDVFSDIGTPVKDRDSPTSKRELSDRATQVLSHAPIYTATSSRLQTLQTLKVPSAAQSSQLIDAKPRIKVLQERQKKIDADVEDLSQRSEHVLRWWIQNGVTGMSEVFEDWETRVAEAAKTIRHEERRRAEAGGYLAV